MITVKLNIPIYHGYLIIIFDDNVNAASKKYDLGNEMEHCGAFVVQKRQPKTGVSQYFMVFNTNHFMHSTIAHEVVHCTNWIFMDRGVKFDYLNDEPYAYLAGWITHQIYKYAYKHKIEVIINLL